jgi:hypothetical protein
MVTSTLPKQLKAQEHSEKIAVSAILGEWLSSDSLYPVIQFTTMCKVHIILKGIDHGVNDYTFNINKDS